MSHSRDILIIGAGPAGLACAETLANNGAKVMVLERNRTIGSKVCAGGITWNGLLKRAPEQLIERSFCRQEVYSNLQKAQIIEKNPLISTVDRQKLGQWMADKAARAGAEILPATHVSRISGNTITATSRSGKTMKMNYGYLVGADGATSMVRRYLNVPVEDIGMGINYQIKGHYREMQWHLNTRCFGSGYGWIFPHSTSISIGAYSPRGGLCPALLKKNLLAWAATRGFDLQKETARAALINYDYRGFEFDNIYLTGEAAGLVSPLTGEGIYPAIVSGEAVARRILDRAHPAGEIFNMLKKQATHRKILRFSQMNRLFCGITMEFLVLMLRVGALNFHVMEMTD